MSDHPETTDTPVSEFLQWWRVNGEYLPEFMRDFHAQKDLFKAMDEVRERSIAKNGGLYMKDINWSDAHVYTVDIFLWVMAGHGYTLQRSRRRFQFSDIYKFMNAARERWNASAASILGLKSIDGPKGQDGADQPFRDEPKTETP